MFLQTEGLISGCWGVVVPSCAAIWPLGTSPVCFRRSMTNKCLNMMQSFKSVHAVYCMSLKPHIETHQLWKFFIWREVFSSSRDTSKMSEKGKKTENSAGKKLKAQYPCIFYLKKVVLGSKLTDCCKICNKWGSNKVRRFVLMFLVCTVVITEARQTKYNSSSVKFQTKT